MKTHLILLTIALSLAGPANLAIQAEGAKSAKKIPTHVHILAFDHEVKEGGEVKVKLRLTDAPKSGAPKGLANQTLQAHVQTWADKAKVSLNDKLVTDNQGNAVLTYRVPMLPAAASAGKPKPHKTLHLFVDFGGTEQYATSKQNATITVKVTP